MSDYLIRKKADSKDSVNLSNIILFLLTLSLLVSDWLIDLIAVSEITMGVILILVIGQRFSILKSINFNFFILMLSYFIIHIGLHIYVNDDFVLKASIYGLAKIVFFSVFINLMYVYIKHNKLESRFLKFLNVGAIIAIVLGLYITLVLITKVDLPYEFFWRFTRTSPFSYEFQGNSDIIRTRSVFSEPAHFGYFLNIVLSLNLFTKYRKNISYHFVYIIVAGIIATLSYASISVMTVLLSFKLITLVKNKKIDFSKYKGILLILIAVLAAYILRDFLYETVVDRTINIVQGTDESAYNRLFNSWEYVDKDNILLGNGIGHTPSVQNIYAYFISDLGLIPFLGIVIFSVILCRCNSGMGILFILLNFQKGGYLSPIFSLFILILFVYVVDFKHIFYSYKRLKYKE